MELAPCAYLGLAVGKNIKGHEKMQELQLFTESATLLALCRHQLQALLIAVSSQR